MIAYVRGRPVSWDDDQNAHVFESSGEVVPDAGGVEPPCPFCGLVPDPGGPDPCLGELPGVASACCGHGVHEGWIRFELGPQLAVRVDYPGAWTPHSGRLTATVAGGGRV